MNKSLSMGFSFSLLSLKTTAATATTEPFISLLERKKNNYVHFSQQPFVWINEIANIFAVNVGFGLSITSAHKYVLFFFVLQWLVATKFNYSPNII